MKRKALKPKDMPTKKLAAAISDPIQIAEIRKMLAKASRKDAHDPSYSDFEELDHVMINLAYHLEQLLTRFRWAGELDVESSLNSSDPMARSYLKNYTIRLACLLVRKYWKEDVSIFNQVISVRHHGNVYNSLQEATCGLTAGELDQVQAFMLNVAADALLALKQKFKGDQDFFARSEEATRNLNRVVSKRISNTDHSSSSDNDLAEQSSTANWPPKLPEITDDYLLKQVFTHKSAISDANMKSKADLLSIHNERLEFKGDSILGFIVSDILYNEFPDDAEGPLTKKKATLVCNDTLFDLSVSYKLHERLRISTDLRGKVYRRPTDKLPDATVKNKAVADVFEAYVAGVAINRGMSVVQQWLMDLYKPFIEEMKSGGEEIDVNKNAKNDLYRKVGSVDQPIVYKTLNQESPFTVSCMIGNAELARGTDRTVKLAGLRAAEAALKDTETVEFYASKRREIPKSAPSTGH